MPLRPPHHLKLHQRRAWLLLLVCNAVCLVGAPPWALALALQRAWLPAALFLWAATVSGGCLWLLARGRLRLAARVTVLALLAYATYNAVWLNAPAPGIPRSAHQYLLALAMLSLLVTRHEPPLWRFGPALAALAVYVGLAGSDFSLAGPPPFDSTVMRWGAWFDHGVAAGVVFVVLHVLQSDATRRSTAEAELLDAIVRDELVLHFQPQVGVDGRLLGLEALVRWQHPQRGLLSPAAFVTLAESSDLVVPLGDWVLRHACLQMADWTDDPDLGCVPVSVNVGAQQFEQPGFAASVHSLLAAQGLHPARLKVELTESALAQDLPTVVDKLRQLRRQGVTVALDDFGTGFSSLGLLRQLPLDQLKIDQCFVRGLGGGAKDRAIVETIIALGRTLGLQVVAEGVETQQQQRVLHQLGCTLYQGYLYGRPMPAADLRRWLHEHRLRRLEAQCPRSAPTPQQVEAGIGP